MSVCLLEQLDPTPRADVPGGVFVGQCVHRFFPLLTDHYLSNGGAFKLHNHLYGMIRDEALSFLQVLPDEGWRYPASRVGSRTPNQPGEQHSTLAMEVASEVHCACFQTFDPIGSTWH